ncbi:MAG: hypothetical protein ACK4ZM_01275, partial [bacterium]
VEGAFISEKFFISSKTSNNIYTISEEKILNFQNIDLNKLIRTKINFVFWKDKISLHTDEKFYIIEEEILKKSLSSNEKYTISYLEEFPKLEELVPKGKDQIIVSFERFPSKNPHFLIPLKKVKLKSNIKEVFVDNIIDQDFSAAVVNYNETMLIYLLEHTNLDEIILDEIILDEIIEYYQKLYLTNTDILWQEKEEIVSFEYCEFIPQTENLLFLGYKNGIYHPFSFVNLDFRIDFYNSVKIDLSKTTYHLLEIKEKFSNFNFKKIFSNLHEITNQLLKIQKN